MCIDGLLLDAIVGATFSYVLFGMLTAPQGAGLGRGRGALGVGGHTACKQNFAVSYWFTPPPSRQMPTTIGCLYSEQTFDATGKPALHERGACQKSHGRKETCARQFPPQKSTPNATVTLEI
jgi:hypothetical protein